ncbi:MAG: siderophore-iron reductase FhuF [Hansschlegelia sp.]
MSIPALAPLFRGALEPFADCLTLTPTATMRAGSDLLDRETLRDTIDHLALTYGDGDRRAVASIWSKHHFSALMPATLAANLLIDLELPVALDDVSVVSDAEGRTRKIVLRAGGAKLSDDRFETRFDALIDGHVTPLIAVLSAVTGASPRVFWSNAGNVFDYVVRGALELGAAPSAVEVGLRLMTERRRKGRPNPLYAPVSYLPEGGRVRRVCCLRYLAPEVGYCGACPIAP